MRIRVVCICNKCQSGYVRDGPVDSDMFNDMRCQNYPRCDGQLQIK